MGSSCVTPAYLYSLETMAMREKTRVDVKEFQEEAGEELVKVGLGT